MAESITPCQSIDIMGVSVVVKREDLNHSVVQGNKLRKLKYNLINAVEGSYKTLVTFGGAYSNHLLATAYAAKSLDIRVVGIVRGDELKNQQSIWSETLYQCQKLGMELHFVDRANYRQKQQSTKINGMILGFESPLVIPEGGSNDLAVKGMAELVMELSTQTRPPTHLLCPVGTGGTLAGIISGVRQMNWNCQVIGVAVLKGLRSVKKDVEQWLMSSDPDVSWQISHDYHCGGYAKHTQELAGFSVAFNQQHGIALDKIYNSKSFYALAHMIQNGIIKSSDRPLIVHTGGLQGGIFETSPA